ncbi:MAG: glycoside hydrolase family 88 protein [Halobacteriaceae archaeon]
MDRTEADALDLLVERVGTTLDGTGEAFPYFADPADGSWTTTPNGNWCGGHWIAMLWRAHEHTADERFADAARAHTETMVEYMPRRCMFAGMNFHYAGFRTFDVTGEDAHRDLGVEGADRMADFFHEGARQIPLGGLDIASPTHEFRGPHEEGGPHGDVLGAVDAIYTSLPVLWRAYRETGHPHYRDVAVSHADRHLDWYVREDGRTWHHAEFDPGTGDLVRQHNDLAYSQETCWARGQGWCIAGLSRAYLETRAGRYLDALERVVDYYETHAPDDGVPHWDLEHPEKPDVNRDTSAAALAAYGLTRLPDAGETAGLRAYGEHVLWSLVEGYLTPRDGDTGGAGDAGGAGDRPRGMVLEGCYNGPAGYADHHELVWTDYYLLETLARRIDAGETAEPAV